jgi:hypothetical protein
LWRRQHWLDLSARQLIVLGQRMQIESSFRDLKSHRYGHGTEGREALGQVMADRTSIAMVGSTEIASFDGTHSHAGACMNSWGYLRF